MDQRMRNAAVSAVSVAIMVFTLSYFIQPAVDKAIPAAKEPEQE